MIEPYRQGWYMRESRWFLTRLAVKQEFSLSKVELDRLLKSITIEQKTLINPYNDKPFTVYALEDLKRLLECVNK